MDSSVNHYQIHVMTYDPESLRFNLIGWHVVALLKHDVEHHLLTLLIEED